MTDDYREQDDDPVIAAGAMLIKTASVERTELHLRQNVGMTRQEAADTVAEATFKIIASAPRELRPSFESVCSYHRWNHMYEMCVKRNQVKEAMDAQRHLDSLLRSVH